MKKGSNRLSRIALLPLLSGGCGTIGTIGQNRSYPVQTYCGTQAEFSSGWAFAHSFPDWPFTIAADTVVLPYTIPATIVNLSTAPDHRKNVGIIGEDSEQKTRPTTEPTSQRPRG